jgi:hypothetical protein
VTGYGRNGGGGSGPWLTTLVWLALLLGVAAIAAGAASHPEALLPIWLRRSWNWIWVLLALSTFAAVTQRRTRRPALVATVAASAVLLGAFGMAAATAVVIITLTAFALGAWLLDRAGTAAGDDVPPPIAATAVGLAALALLLGVTAHFSINTAPAYLGLSAVVIWGGRRRVAQLARHLAAVIRARSFEATPPFAVGVALWFGFGIEMYYAALPERYHDALAMHLVIPRAIEQFGRWNFDAADNVWAVWPLGADLLFGWAYVLAGEAGAKLLNLALLLLTCGLVVEAKFASRAASLAAVAAFMLMPLTVLETGSLFVENALALFLGAAIVFALRLARHPAQSVAGIAFALGGAVVVKLYGVVALGAAALAVTFAGSWRAAFAVPRRVWGIALVPALLGAWPYAYAWIVTGNPIFPFYNAIFRSPLYPPENFGNSLYPGGLSWRDLYDLTFSSSRYLESWDGALGFVLLLLLPAGLVVVARRGSPGLRIAVVAALAYIAAVLLSTRYLRYLYPALPWLFLGAAAPLDFLAGRSRSAVAVLLAFAVGAGIARIPSAGWIIGEFNLTMAFTPRDKEAYADGQVPMRVLGRAQAAIGDRNSKTAIFGAPVGAYVKGRPLYAHWYHALLGMQVHSITSAEDAARALAALSVTHVMFDLRAPDGDFRPWREAAARYGRLVYRIEGGELYEFDATSVDGVDLLGDGAEPWLAWQSQPPLPRPDDAREMVLPAGQAVSRGVDLSGLHAGTPVTLAVLHACAVSSSVRVQINWLAQNGDILRTDAVRSDCGPSPSGGRLRASVPQRARLAYAFFVNDGANAARLSDARMEAVTDVAPRTPR